MKVPKIDKENRDRMAHVAMLGCLALQTERLTVWEKRFVNDMLFGYHRRWNTYGRSPFSERQRITIAMIWRHRNPNEEYPLW